MHVWWNLGFGQNKRKGGGLGVGSVRRVWSNTFLNSPTFLQQRRQIKKVAKSKISNKTRLQVGEKVRCRDLYGPPQQACSRVYSRNQLFTVWQVGSGQVQHQWYQVQHLWRNNLSPGVHWETFDNLHHQTLTQAVLDDFPLQDLSQRTWNL